MGLGDFRHGKKGCAMAADEASFGSFEEKWVALTTAWNELERARNERAPPQVINPLEAAVLNAVARFRSTCNEID